MKNIEKYMSVLNDTNFMRDKKTGKISPCNYKNYEIGEKCENCTFNMRDNGRNCERIKFAWLFKKTYDFTPNEKRFLRLVGSGLLYVLNKTVIEITNENDETFTYETKQFNAPFNHLPHGVYSVSELIRSIEEE